MSASDLVSSINNQTIARAVLKSNAVLQTHQSIFASISGGADSDIVVDLLERIRYNQNIDYVFIDTGLEYKATKEHLKLLENKYQIKINSVKAIKSIPTCVKQYGVPFLSKQVSQNLYYLQMHGFQYEDMDFESLQKKYQHCIGPLRWWCNAGESRQYNIEFNKYLKEFIMQYPPNFKISDKCCVYAKKKTSKSIEKPYDLKILGLRKCEGGVRSGSISSCYTESNTGIDLFRPIWWFSDADKSEYEQIFDIQHSECYTKYGFVRTGCAGCPFNMNVFDDLDAVKQYEPNFYSAANNVFRKSYEYTKMYREYRQKMEEKSRGND